MLLERAELQIKEGLEKDFINVMNEQGLPILTGVPGVGSAKLGRGVENPGKFLLLVEWDSIEAHTAFKGSPTYPGFTKLLGPFSKGGVMEHFDMF